MQHQTNKRSRSQRVRARLKSSLLPRLSVYRTNAHIWAQLINDQTHTTLASADSKTLPAQPGDTKTMRASAVGAEIARLAQALHITRIVFDRGSYKYHGRVKAVAEAARLTGLQF